LRGHCVLVCLASHFVCPVCGPFRRLWARAMKVQIPSPPLALSVAHSLCSCLPRVAFRHSGGWPILAPLGVCHEGSSPAGPTYAERRTRTVFLFASRRIAHACLRPISAARFCRHEGSSPAGPTPRFSIESVRWSLRGRLWSSSDSRGW